MNREAIEMIPDVKALPLPLFKHGSMIFAYDEGASKEEDPLLIARLGSKDYATAIVRACNSHHKLVEALEEARDGLAAWTGGEDGACGDTIAKINAALSIAKGE